VTNKEQMAALYRTAQELSAEFERIKGEANDYIHQVLVEANVEHIVSQKQKEVEEKRAEIQTLVDVIASKIQELKNEKAPE
jgi:hypothetical protein